MYSSHMGFLWSTPHSTHESNNVLPKGQKSQKCLTTSHWTGSMNPREILNIAYIRPWNIAQVVGTTPKKPIIPTLFYEPGVTMCKSIAGCLLLALTRQPEVTWVVWLRKGHSTVGPFQPRSGRTVPTSVLRSTYQSTRDIKILVGTGHCFIVCILVRLTSPGSCAFIHPKL